LRTVSPQTYLDFARENPAAILGVGLGAASLAGLMVARNIAESRRQNRPSERLRRTVMSAAEQLSETAHQALAAVPSLPVSVQVGTSDAKGSDKESANLSVKGKDQGMLKKALWSGLVALMMAGGGLLARRLSAGIWKSAMGEAPPTKNV